MRLVERVLIAAALFAAAFATYAALDARSDLKEQGSEISALQARVNSFHPTLVIESRGGDPFARSLNVPEDQSVHNLRMPCGDDGVTVAAGYNSLGLPTVVAVDPEPSDGALIRVVNQTGRFKVKVAPVAVCAYGEEGLKVTRRSADIRPQRDP